MMKHIPALALILAASAVSAVSCSTGAGGQTTTPDPAPDRADGVHQLQQEIMSQRGDGQFTETRMGGGVLSGGEESSLRFDPVVSGPIAASFLCDTGTVSVSMAGEPPADVLCGQIKTFSGVEPFEFGTGLMITVASEEDTNWAVEFRSEG